MPLLICEGPCNSERALLDAMVNNYRREETRSMDGKRMPLEDPKLVLALRKLKHTHHTEVSPESTHFTCSLCGTVRRSGGAVTWRQF